MMSRVHGNSYGLENGGVDDTPIQCPRNDVCETESRAIDISYVYTKNDLTPCDEVGNYAALVKRGEAEWLTVLTNDGPDEWICNVKGKDRTPSIVVP